VESGTSISLLVTEVIIVNVSFNSLCYGWLLYRYEDRAERPNHVWSYDFVHNQTHDGRAYRILKIIEECTKEASMIRVDRKLNSTDVVDALTDLFILCGAPEYIRSDNGLWTCHAFVPPQVLV
jgi:hypothetical protein